MLNPIYKIITPRLTIRCYNPADAQKLERSIHESLDHLLPWMPWAAAEPEPFATKIERLRRMRSNFDLSIDYVYGIFTQDEKILIGGTGLHPRVGSDAFEIGYWIHKDYLHKGIATEASAALIKVAFEIIQVDRIEIHCSVENIFSAAIPQKLQFKHEATLQKRSYANGHASEQMIWSIFADEYPKSPASNLKIAAFDAAERQIL